MNKMRQNVHQHIKHWYIYAAYTLDGTTPSVSSCYASFNVVVVGCKVPEVI